MSVEDRLATGLAHHRAGRLSQAAASYRALLDEQPDHADAWHLLGVVAAQDGRVAQAPALMMQAIARNPNIAAYHANLGGALRALRRPQDALQALDRALSLQPGYWEALAHRGAVLHELGRREDALASLEAALAIREDAGLLQARGLLLTAEKRFGEAAASFQRMLALDPHRALGAGQVLYCRMREADWRDLDDLVERILAGVREGGLPAGPMDLLTITDSLADQRACARTYAGAMAGGPAPAQRTRERRPGRIRVGYLSSDLGEHPVGYMISALIKAHDRERFEVFGLALADRPEGGFKTDLAASFDRFLTLDGLDDGVAVQAIADLDLDLLVDLNGHTLGARPAILAARPAPVQASFLGYPATWGAGVIDYLIADRVVVPETAEPLYEERIVRLADSFFPAADHRAFSTSDPVSRAQMGLPDAGVVFGGFTALHKLHPTVFAVWMEILRATPGSVLWMSAASPAAQETLARAAAAGRVDPGRLVFAQRVAARAGHLARYALADLFLDTFPYGAHSTAHEALWFGLPVLTCAGEGFASRVGASLLTAAGTPELICRDLTDYRERAVALAADRGALSDLRARLLAARDASPLFDAARYARNLEMALSRMHERRLAGVAPAPIDLERSPL